MALETLLKGRQMPVPHVLTNLIRAPWVARPRAQGPKFGDLYNYLPFVGNLFYRGPEAWNWLFQGDSFLRVLRQPGSLFLFSLCAFLLVSCFLFSFLFSLLLFIIKYSSFLLPSEAERRASSHRKPSGPPLALGLRSMKC